MHAFTAILIAAAVIGSAANIIDAAPIGPDMSPKQQPPAAAAVPDLSGHWHGDDGGGRLAYDVEIRQNGRELELLHSGTYLWSGSGWIEADGRIIMSMFKSTESGRCVSIYRAGKDGKLVGDWNYFGAANVKDGKLVGELLQDVMRRVPATEAEAGPFR